MTKTPWLAPDIAASIASGRPAPWLAPDIANAIATRHKTIWLDSDITAPVVDADLPALSVTA